MSHVDSRHSPAHIFVLMLSGDDVGQIGDRVLIGDKAFAIRSMKTV